MSDRDWDRELADIDRRLGAGSPEAAAARGARAPASAVPPLQGAAVDAVPPRRSVGTPAGAPGRRSWRAQLALLLRLVIGVAVVAALVYWPYPARCGAGLAYYLVLVAALAVAGLTTATSAWRHRAPFVHVLGLVMLAAAAVLGARDVLPRVGYAVPTAEHPAAWSCAIDPAGGPGAAAPTGAPNAAPNAVPNASPGVIPVVPR